MINYEVGGKLYHKNVQKYILHILEVNKGHLIVSEVLARSFPMYFFEAQRLFDYEPPVKECKTCKGSKTIWDYEAERKCIEASGRGCGHVLHTKSCPECTKPKQEFEFNPTIRYVQTC